MVLGIRNEAYARKVSPEAVEALRSIRSTDASDVMNSCYTMDAGIRPVNLSKARVVGPALTVYVPNNSENLIAYAFHSAQPGDVVVVAAGGNMTSVLAGGNMLRGFLNRGGVGAIFDGIVRDLSEIKEDGLPVFARGVGCAEGPTGPESGELNVPVACGNTVVNPGDYIIADEDGIVAIPADHVDQVISAVRELDARNQSVQDALVNGNQANIDEISVSLELAGFQLT